MSILITGAGMVGCHFALRAAAKGERIVFLDLAPSEAYLANILGDTPYDMVRADVRDLPAITAAIQSYKVDTVLHTAALIGGKVSANTYTGVSVNVMGTVNVAEAVRLCGVGKFIYCSTIGVYSADSPLGVPLDEDAPQGGQGLYGASKVACESILKAYADQYGFEVVALRYSSIFGRGTYVAGSAAGEIINELIVTPLRGEVVRVPRARVLTVEYTYVKDIARAIELAWQAKKLPHREYNIGAGVLSTADDVIAEIRTHIPDAKYEFIPAPDDDTVVNMRAQLLDSSRARDELGFTAEYDLAAAIADYVREARARM